MIDMNERLNLLRKELRLSQEEFGKRLGVGKSAISYLESGRSSLTDQMIKLICKEFNVSEDWIRTGNGEMRNVLEEDETARFVGELLFDTDNPFYDIIKEVIRTYVELDPKSQDVLKMSAVKFLENIKKEG